MEKFTIIIVGRGKLAKELLEGLDSPNISSAVRWDERKSLGSERLIVVHAGSGRELDEVIKFCACTRTILLDLATGEASYPAKIKFPVVICPNVNMQMIYFMAMIKHSSRYFRGQNICISESHQASKKTKPGTAAYLAKSLGIPETEIYSERDPCIQTRDLGIPSLFLDRHAYHQIVIRNREVEIRMETKVLGKTAYASGLAKVIDIIARIKLNPGCHDIVDLVINNI